ncbi:MAG: hypothetical protein IJ692_02430 [Alloprevotella sp.]|nr:hypothetical protein [Alloprevotella sp.]
MESTYEQALEDKLQREARYLYISIPYDEDDGYEMITFDDGLATELQCKESFIPPMFNSENRALEVMVDLKERRALGWDEEKGYIHMWGKVVDSGTYTLLDVDKEPLWQIKGYVPNALIPPYERGFGDYLELTINPDGSLPDWKEELNFSDFVESGCDAQHIQNQQDKRKVNPNEAPMKEYIIFTTEGQTIAPNEDVEIENCQVLGRARGNNPEEAKDNLLKDNPWIAEAGFSRSEFIVEQLMTDEERVAIKEVLDYLWDDEERHYQESGKPDNHIFPVLERLKMIIK